MNKPNLLPIVVVAYLVGAYVIETLRTVEHVVKLDMDEPKVISKNMQTRECKLSNKQSEENYYE